MAKFFVNPEDVSSDIIMIKGTDVNHIKNVLRLPIGKEILINDRQGNDYECIIKEINTEMVTAQIINHMNNHTEPAVDTVLFQSLVKGEKMEFVIQKSVEIGVTKIVPLVTKRCVVKLESENKLNNKIVRWQKIAESAAKQSKRGIVPEVTMPMTLQTALEFVKTQLDCGCIPYENESAHHIKEYLQSLDAKSIGIFIGPEGGFTEEEVALAIEYGVQSITLGKRILRSETAGLVTLANIMYEMGEI
ncbi:MAG: 16S rRNA (uracil(1498)-N(3))-methyltransferase [Cellulosilyticum sp.]|nr:16S rRNA (uracil(1498)-N(3))-methyltransferase [Cellulosilyticum sp.]